MSDEIPERPQATVFRKVVASLSALRRRSFQGFLKVIPGIPTEQLQGGVVEKNTTLRESYDEQKRVKWIPLTKFFSLAVALLVVAPHVSEECVPASPNAPEADESRPLQQRRSESTVPTGEYASQNSPMEGGVPSVLERRQLAFSFVTDAVKKVGPAVVRIDTETYVANDDFLPTTGSRPGTVEQGQGSGVIFSADGLILTNSHVVDGASKVTVTLTDGQVFDAEVRGSDEIVDIAVLRILGSEERIRSANLPTATLGDSDDLSVGQIVVAVGSPGGLDNTVTMGIVSGLERSSTVVGIPHKKVDFIQTDCAINGGSSGGPLVLVESGTVIGINAVMRAYMEGTGFSIPINKVREIMHDLSQGKEIQHGYVGISLATCNPEWARRENSRLSIGKEPIPELTGALVHKVYPRTPAEKGGLVSGDVITAVDDTGVQSSDDARKLIDKATVGRPLRITIRRGKEEMILQVTPVDLATRLRQDTKERQLQLQRDTSRPFQAVVQQE